MTALSATTMSISTALVNSTNAMVDLVLLLNILKEFTTTTSPQNSLIYPDSGKGNLTVLFSNSVNLVLDLQIMDAWEALASHPLVADLETENGSNESRNE